MEHKKDKPAGMLDGLLVHAGYFYMYLMGKTARVSVRSNPEYDELKKSGRPFIFAVWHGRQVFLTWFHRHENRCVMISKSKDGEFITRIVEKLGYQPVRGSSSKGGNEALAEMVHSSIQMLVNFLMS